MTRHEWVEELAKPGERCLHLVLLQPDEVRALSDWIVQRDLKLAELDGSCITSKGELLDAVARSLRFPDYFGRNWDALDECLRDLEWLPASGYVILLTDADRFWQNDPGAFIVFLSVVARARDEWAKENVPFHLVAVGHQVAEEFRYLTSRISVH
jgi:RNAse (barnase) inhibitor barstar